MGSGNNVGVNAEAMRDSGQDYGDFALDHE